MNEPNGLFIITNLLACSMACGLVFALLIQPNRDRMSFIFAGFCASLGLWMFVATLVELSDEKVMLFQLEVSIMILVIVTYFYFIVAYLKPSGYAASILLLITPLVSAISCLFVWIVDVFSFGVDGKLLLHTPALILLALGVFYLLICFWMIISSHDNHTDVLRGPTLLLLLVYITNGFETIHSFWFPINPLLIVGITLMLGSAILRHQVFNPLNDLNAELKIANFDLQQVINDLAIEKARTEDLNRDLVAANRYKSEFMANMSHELRTPLNSILGYSELLRQGVYGTVSDKQNDRLEKIHRNGLSLLALITDILDLNKIDAGRVKLTVESFDLKKVFNEILNNIRPLCEQKGLKLDSELQEGLPALFGDEGRIKQILSIFSNNAVKFTKDGGVTLKAQSVTIKNGQSTGFSLPAAGWLRDGKWIIITIKDTGIGIPVEDQSRIFDEFSQVDGSHTREFGGTGLGLAIGKRLVEMHGGSIWVKSIVGKGSSFFVAFPNILNNTDT